MTDAAAARAFLLSEIEALEPFGAILVGPAGKPLHLLEVTRREDGGLEVRVPGRMPMLPELPVSVRSALRDRGFASEKPDDRTVPWIRAVEGPEAAADQLRALLTEVFAEKADVPLDIAHGSHRAEHEARQKLAAVREHVERVLTEMLKQKPEQDEDGDYLMPIGDVRVTVAPRAIPAGPVIVRVFAVTNVGVDVRPELGLFLARMNFGLMFGRFALDVEHASIWFDETLLGDQITDEELRFAVQVVASTADEWDDRIKQMFGGATWPDVMDGHAEHPRPSAKPGGDGYL